MDNNLAAAQYILNILCTLVVLHVNCTQSLVALILAEGRRRRLKMLECASSASTAAIQLYRLHSQQHAARSCWMQVRSRDWWEREVLKEFTDAEWRQTFRMTRASFDKLCGLMEEVLRPQEVTVRAPIPLQMRVAIVLYQLATCAEYRVVADRFGVHKSTVKKFVYAFCKGMVSSATQRLIRLPSAEEARGIARGFERRFHIPQIVGCIGGTHIPVLPPTDGHTVFVNQKGWHSYVLQAAVDDTYRFWNINCEMPGSAQHADVLRRSALFAQAHQLPKEPRDVSSTSVDLFLLGGPAYPLLSWLMKGYAPSPRITAEQERFNAHLSAARSTVQVAFRRMRSRWQVLVKRSDFHYTFTPHVIATCCALHNFCESEREAVDPAWTQEAERLERRFPQPDAQVCGAAEDAGAQAVRFALTEHVAANFSTAT